MASKLKRQRARKMYGLNYLEGKRVLFTSGKWEGQQVTLDKRNKKGIWTISTYIRFYGWDYDTITDEQLVERCLELKSEFRDYKLSRICNYK